MIRINDDWNLVTAWGEECSGSGWANTPVWAIVARVGTLDYKMVCLQPKEQSSELAALIKISHVVNTTMMGHVSRLVLEKIKGFEAAKLQRMKIMMGELDKQVDLPDELKECD